MKRVRLYDKVKITHESDFLIFHTIRESGKQNNIKKQCSKVKFIKSGSTKTQTEKDEDFFH